MAKKKICVVTGGAGFIGSHITDELLKRGYRVRVLDNLSTGFARNLKAIRPGAELIRADIRNEKAVKKALRGADTVFHLAANRAVLRSVDDPLDTNDVNVTGTLKMLIAARSAKVRRFVFTSSSSVYGDTKKFPCLETDRPLPQSPYAASKIMGEYYCNQFTNLYGLSTVSLRYFNVFGPRQNPESKYSAVIPILIDCLLKKKSPEIHWDGKQSRDFSYIDNVVEGNMRAMTAPMSVSGETFNIACHEEYSILDIFNSLKKILDIHDVKPVFKPKRAGDVRRTYADIRKSKRLLKFKVQTRFYPGLEKTAAWFLESKYPNYKKK